MLRRILVPVDFSPESLKTLLYAKPLAKIFGANLHLVNVANPPPIFPPRRAMLPLPFSETEVGRSAKQRLKSRCGIFAASRANTHAGDEMEKLRRAVSRKSVAIETEIADLKPAPGEEGQEREITICAGHSTSSALAVST